MITIDQDLGIDYRDAGPWRSYQLTAQGSTLRELKESATIEEIDQDGGELNSYGLDDSSSLIYSKALNIITLATRKDLIMGNFDGTEFQPGDIIVYVSETWDVFRYDKTTRSYVINSRRDGRVGCASVKGLWAIFQAATGPSTASQPAMQQPKAKFTGKEFKALDVIELDKPSSKNHRKQYLVHQFNYVDGWYELTRLSDGKPELAVTPEHWHLVLKAVSDNKETINKEERKCTCEIRLLWNRGCQCGSIVPYRRRVS